MRKVGVYVLTWDYDVRISQVTRMLMSSCFKENVAVVMALEENFLFWPYFVRVERGAKLPGELSRF